MSGEAGFAAGYALVLLAVVGALELYGRQSTSAWSSRIFAGYRRAVPDPPEPAEREDWPHSEVGRFHRVLSLSISGVAVVLLAAELFRHHRPVEVAVLVGIAIPHCVLLVRMAQQLARVPVPPPG